MISIGQGMLKATRIFLDFNPSIQNGLCPCPQFDLFPIAQGHHLRFDKAGVQQGGAKF